MKRKDYPVIYGMRSYLGSDNREITNVLFWEVRDLYIPINTEIKSRSDLHEYLTENMDKINEELPNIPFKLNTDVILEIVDLYAMYDDFNSELSVEVATELLNYKTSIEEIPNKVCIYFGDNAGIDLRSSKFDEVREQFKFAESVLEGTTYYTLNNVITFGIDYYGDMTIINDDQYDSLLTSIFRCIKASLPKAAERPSYPRYIEDYVFDAGDEKYVFVDNQFVPYDTTRHDENDVMFKRLETYPTVTDIRFELIHDDETRSFDLTYSEFLEAICYKFTNKSPFKSNVNYRVCGNDRKSNYINYDGNQINYQHYVRQDTYYLPSILAFHQIEQEITGKFIKIQFEMEKSNV